MTGKWAATNTLREALRKLELLDKPHDFARENFLRESAALARVEAALDAAERAPVEHRLATKVGPGQHVEGDYICNADGTKAHAPDCPGCRLDAALRAVRDKPTDDPRCPELNPKSTSEDRCDRPAGHSGDHASVLHSGRMKIYPSKWNTPADNQEGKT